MISELKYLQQSLQDNILKQYVSDYNKNRFRT